MTGNLQSLTSDQLRRALSVKIEIERLEAEMAAITGGSSPPVPKATGQKRTMSAAGRARIAAAARERWAKYRSEKGTKPAEKVDGRSTPAARAKLAAAARARWRKAKAAGKTTL